MSNDSVELGWRIIGKDIDAVKEMIANGCDVDGVDYFGHPHLLNAVYVGSVDMVKILLDAGANVNESNEAGYTALHFAVHNDHLEIAKILVDAGADLNAKSGYGLTPLQRAYGGSRVAKFLTDVMSKEKKL